MRFASILDEAVDAPPSYETALKPDFFGDLNLDQVVDAVTLGRDEYNLKPFFYAPPPSVETVLYRQEVMQDLTQDAVLACVTSFSQKMQLMREQIAKLDKLHYQLQKQRVFLDAIACYCDAVTTLSNELSRSVLRSRGMAGFRAHISAYVRSKTFITLRNDMQEIKAELFKVEYSLLIHNGSVNVRKRGPESDYSRGIAHTFARFRQSSTKDYEFKLRDYLEMNHIEAGILDFVRDLFPEIFMRLAQYFSEHQQYSDHVIRRWDREIQFYVSYLDYIRPLQRAGLAFSYPVLSSTSKAVQNKRTFDIALAHKLVGEDIPVVTNDFEMNGPERIFVVSGPNQGGKTTFARTFGQVHYLARLGCPVPGSDMNLFFYDKLLTHFEKEEDIHTHRGKLEDEIIRTHDILRQATSQSIVILNEVFTSTTLHDALFLSRRILERLIKLDLLCVCVTFMDELSALGPETVSLVSTVVPNNPTERTYRVIRQRPDGHCYAMSIAEKYRVTYGRLKERLSS